MAAQDWPIECRAGTWLVTAGLLGRAPGVAHAFSTRRDGESATDFDLGRARGASTVERERRRALCRAAGFGDREPIVLEQVHGARVVTPQEPPGGTIEVGDALYATAAAGDRPILAVRTADCAPVVLAAEDGSAVAAIHAGWRGAAVGVVPQTVLVFAREGIAPERLLAAVGPTIGPCCYAVGPEVVRAVAERTGVAEDRIRRRTADGRASLDLPGSLGLQLRASGLSADRIGIAPWCTCCHADLFFSYRRDGRVAGRMMAVIGWMRPVP